MEEGAVGVVGAPVVVVALPVRESLGEGFGSFFGCRSVVVFACCFIEFCSGGEGAVVVYDIFFPVIGHGCVLFFEEGECFFCCLEVLGVGVIAGLCCHGCHGEGGDGYSPTRPVAGLVAAPV